MSEHLDNNVYIRCPSCSKLYVVDSAEIRTEKPQFECVTCQTRFWFSHPSSPDLLEIPTFVVGEPAARSQPPGPSQISPIETFHCIKCGYKNPKGAAECVSCGLVFEKFRKKNLGVREDIKGSTELRKAWSSVIEDYTNQALHEAFIKLSLAQNNLPFASQQYRQILESSPSEDVASKMRDKIINLATQTYIPEKRLVLTKQKKISVPVVIIFVGVIFFMTGFLSTQLRSVMPIGAVFCAVGFAIIYYSKKN